MARPSPTGNTKSAIVLRGADELRRDFETNRMLGPHARKFGEKWGIATHREATKNVPKDKGHLRRSLTWEVDPAPMPKYARVGTNLDPEGRAMEGGTGTLADLPGGTGMRHWPPAAALDEWANRKQIESRDRPGYILTGRDIAAIIGRRGGLKPRRFLRNAADESEKSIDQWLSELGDDVVKGMSQWA